MLSCGLICILVIWMDIRELPRALWPPRWLVAMNSCAAVVFLAVGLKGYWENENRFLIACSMVGIVGFSLGVAAVLGPRLSSWGEHTSHRAD